MRLLIILALCLLPLSALAQSVPLLLPASQNDSLTVLHPAPGVSYYYDQHGNSSTVYEQNAGQSWYSQQDRYGRITSQGYLFDPMPRPEPLQVPRFEHRELDSPGKLTR